MLAESLRGRQIAVRLNIPTAHNMPATGGDMRPDPFKEGGGIIFNDLIKPRLAAGDVQFGVFVQQFAGGAGSGKDFVDPLLPFPQPNRVQM